MTTPMMPAEGGDPQPSFIAIIDVDDTIADSVLEELTREGIAAYAVPLGDTPADSPSGAALDPAAGTSADATGAPPAEVRIHVDRSRVPVARAIIASRLPQAGSRFLTPRDTAAPSLTAEEVDEAWARLVRGWDPSTDSQNTDPRLDGSRGESPGGSGLSDRLIRRHGSRPIDPADPADLTGPVGATGPTDRAGAPAEASKGPRDYALDHDPLDDDAEGFVPPEPPPLPRPRHSLDIIGWSGAIGGPAVLVANQVLSWGSWLSGVGVAAFMGGFVILVSRMRNERDHDDPGAVV